ncbi:DNA ligase D [Brevundimonas sp. SORGH_AS_0993]|uniref:DNA ligase D n=1 Tax=Brevundimonas sp. SORGH_AS_0993 TaxID=3041794 RepID=UPI0027807BF2|nr:DNA ligase D [Brevundimonas sp. SORGH_AS_0993]MDQ1154476.1 bifunctional non-homologous end joining protein LigD [Brevundimonas sp. SORGH_AS_0993]
MSDKLAPYRAKRDFNRTAEPRGKQGRTKGEGGAYLIQRHAATRLHYDFRIEHDGVLKSWAVTKAPSRDPAVKRLAVEVEDHPLAYGTFEGTIPQGDYGGGTVQLWDRGAWTPQEPDVEAALKRGSLKMTLDGERLSGGWALVRLKSDRGKPSKRNNWLLIKEKDEHAVPGEGDANMEIDASVTTGRTLAEIAAGNVSWPTRPKAGAARTQAKSAPKPKPAAKPTARKKASGPHAFLPLQLCKTADHPPGGAGWVHEIKFDGYRIQISTGGGQARLYTRKGLDWSDRFPELARDAAAWPEGVWDGEVCALNAENAPDFSALQTALSEQKTGSLVFFAFDLLRDGDEDLRDLPLARRKARLEALVDRVPAKARGRLRYVDHFGASGQAVLESACRMDLEGVISKQLDAPYRGGRSATWVKSKCRGRDEVVIGGWSSEAGRFRSLLVGTMKGGGLTYLGRVGTGYSAALMKTLRPALEAAAADASPFVGRTAPSGRGVHWVKPILIAEVEHGGYTEAGALRQAAFKGLREDKTANEVTARPQAPTTTRSGRTVVAGVTLSNPDKVLWPATDRTPEVTKVELAAFYEKAAARLLAHVGDRPLSIIRAPDGIAGQTFFQRHAGPGGGPRLKRFEVGDRQPYVGVTDVGGLVALAQSGGLELHPWGCRPDDPETPDQVTFDLDPDTAVDFAAVIAAAKAVKARLEDLGLTPFVKTTGGKGLHVVAPIRSDSRSRVDWDQCKAFAKAVAEAMRQDAPERFTTTLAKKARGGKIFIDYLRNGRMATAVAPWSPRARPGAPLAMPIGWSQVKAGLDPRVFTLPEADKLLKKPDPWADFRKAEASLRPALKALRL